MFPSDREWRQNCQNWQSGFIHNNLLVLGYFAWLGFKLSGGGLLVCNVEPPPIGAELRLHSWDFTTQFVPNRYLADYLPRVKIPASEIPALIESITASNPRREIVLLTNSGESVEIFWLRNLATLPPAAYSAVRHRWDEFMSK
jgi:hypothetical protein